VALTQRQVAETMAPVVSQVSERIAQEIVSLNGDVSPQAVILVGGGLTKSLPENLAGVLQIPTERVGVQLRERIKNVCGDESVTGSDVITALGIGIADFENRTLHYYSVKVNGVVVSIFELQLASVAEALLAAGIQPRLFLGRPGQALVYTLNGEMKIVKGEPGSNAEIFVNGEKTRLEHKIAPGDEIEFAPGVNGADAKVRLKNVISLNKSKNIWYNGREEAFVPRVCVNSEPADGDQWLNDGDVVAIVPNDTLEDLLQTKGLSLNVPNTVHVHVDGEERVFSPRRDVFFNGEIVAQDRALADGDRVDVNYETLLLKDLDLKAEPLPLYLNNRRFFLKPKQTRVFSEEGMELTESNPVDEGMVLSVQGFSEEPILSDVVPFVSDIHAVSSRSSLRLEINEKEAGFSSRLHEGDRILIEWVK